MQMEMLSRLWCLALDQTLVSRWCQGDIVSVTHKAVRCATSSCSLHLPHVRC